MDQVGMEGRVQCRGSEGAEEVLGPEVRWWGMYPMGDV